MAESVVYAVMQRLANLLIEEMKFLYGVSSEVVQIQAEFKRMQCFLRDADERQDEDKTVHNWIAEIREIAYDVEDVLENFALKVSLRKEKGFLKRYAGKLKEGITLHQVGSEIRGIKTRISTLTRSMQTYGIKAISQEENSYSTSKRRPDLRRSYSHLIEEDFVGLEEDVEHLVAHLINEDGGKCYKVLAICGMGGLGKTTLARKVYHHGDVRSHFQAVSWLCISQQWQEKDVLQGILSKLVPEKREKINNMREEELMKELYEVQERKKCLVVLDDIWSADFWDMLGPAFSNRNMNSKILLTSRNRDVALGINPTCLMHEPRFLNEDESWELLQKKASPTRSTAGISTEMEKLGREMIAQCGGLPLAIIVLSGILVTKPSLTEWKMVHQNLNSYLKRGRNFGQYGRVYLVLALSYSDLPYQVKPCFLHLGNFQEDSKIPTRKLYELWAAEGFLPLESHDEGEAKSIMDVGQRYLGELAHRRMVQVQVEESTGRFKSCQLHDLMRDLCLTKGKEENFLKIISHQNENRQAVASFLPKAASTCVMRRLSVFLDWKLESYFPPKNETTARVRSLLLFGGKSKWQSTRQHLPSTFKLICSDFKLLRVLDLEGFYLGIKPSKAVGNLVHLRYLSFRKSEFKVLPSSVSHLKYLQTLDLRVDFFSYLTLPDVIWKLENLRHLYLPPSHKNTYSLHLSGLKNLETLKNFDSRVSDVRDILELTKLQKLGAIFSVKFNYLRGIINYLAISPNHIRDSSFRIDYKFRSEVELSLLKQLLGCHHVLKLHLIGHIKKLPEYSHFSSSLTHLNLSWSGLKEDPMATLEKLPRLNSLIFYGNVYKGKEICCSSQGFPQLETLSLQKLPNLEEWKLEPGAMPNLLNLKIVGCEKLTMLPDGLTFMTKIKELSIGDMPIDFTCRILVVNGGGEDFHKVQHIPSIRILDTLKWMPPPRGEYKLNISACVTGDPGPAGFGGLVRDGQGVWQYGYMGSIGRSTTIEAHLWSLREGLEIAKYKGITGIKVEMHNLDALHLVEGLTEMKEYKLLVEDCRELFRQIDGTFNIALGSRNAAADFLAKEGEAKDDELIIFDQPPKGIRHILLEDCSFRFFC